MTKDDLVKRVAFRMGNVRGQDAMIGTEVDATISRLENDVFHPWFLLSENNTYLTVVGESRVPLPKGFLMEYEEGSLYIKRENGSWETLPKKPQDVLNGKFLEQGMPQAYALTNNYFRLFPTPDKEYELELIFFRRSESLQGENPWFTEAAEWVIYETCFEIMNAKGHDRAPVFKTLATEQKRAIAMKHTERMEVNNETLFGGDD